MYDLKITGARVIDPYSSLDGVADVAVQNGVIACVAPGIEEPARQVIGASGCIVTPGLIDHHAHLYPLIANGIPAEAVCFASGVTTVVDAGSTGAASIEQHVSFFQTTKLDVKAFLHINPMGLSSLPELEDVSPQSIQPEPIAKALSRYGDRLLGLKLRTSREIVGEHGLEPLKKSLQIADKLGVPLMVHCTNPPVPMGQLLDLLRPGDILTHMYQNIGSTILDEAGAVSQAARKARQRGVIFEAADARAHFSFAVAAKAVEQEFLPDVISTDLTAFSMLQRPTAFSLAMQIAKYACLGIPLSEVVRRCTQNPAALMGLAGKAGCLAPGSQGDIAVFEPLQIQNEFGDRPYQDEGCTIRTGTTLYRPVVTVKKGKIVYRDVIY